MLYSLLPIKEIQWSKDNPFIREFYENCFKITFTVCTDEGSIDRITLNVSPEEKGYELIVTFVISVNGTENWTDCDLWNTNRRVFDLVIDKNDNTDKTKIGFSLNVHDVLSPKNLHVTGGFRNLRILCSTSEYFVNSASLNQIGGSLFKDWYNRGCTGETTVVVTDIDEAELDALLMACCAYSSVIITKQNFEILIDVAWKYKIVGILRAIEHYLLNAKGIHVISKLDYSYKYKFSMLCSYVLKTLSTKFQRKEALLDYLTKNNMPFCPNHLMETLEIQSLT